MTTNQNPAVRPICDYCQNEARFVSGDKIYPHRPDLKDKKFYACFQCKAWVGCHPGTDVPLGRLANAALRRWRGRAHHAFDALWQRIGAPMSRTEAYAWLANGLGIAGEDCHIGMFEEEACKRTVELARAYRLPLSGEKHHA